MDRQGKLFVGFKPEGKLRLAYGAAQPGEYVMQGGAGKFLTALEVDGVIYLGKVVDGGLETDRVEDVAKNVLSILKRFAGGERLPSALAIFAVTE